MSKGPFGWICLGGSSPVPPGGSCTHCIRTDSRPAAPGALLWDGSRTVARSGRCTAMLSMSQTTGARTRAICCPFHLHTHLKLCQQLPSSPPLFAPSRKLILHHPQGHGHQTSRVQLAGHMVTEFCLKKQWTLTFLSQVSRLQHSSQAHCCSLHPLLAMTSSTSHLRSMMESLPLTD